ncbi:MAG TPA: hypothetical protein VHM31_13025 [Polyangia bacterium]|nr:hypothetical protein [Polyangia bacterium]
MSCCLFWWAASCSTPSTDTSTGSGGKGGGTTTSEGGNRGSGGQTGGTVGSGGSGQTGGSFGSGGSGGSPGSGGRGGTTATGGTTGSGGTLGSGGRGGSGTGGSNSGGTTGTGGNGTGGNATGGNGSGGNGTGGTGRGGTTGTGGTSTGGTPGANQPPPITNGQSGWASRYWDCCKPACGWKANVSHGNPMMSCDMSNNSLGGNYDAKNSCENGGTAYMCWSGSPWQVSSTLSYGFAAASGGNYACGRCYQIQFTGTNNTNGDHKGVPALNGKTMIVQVINNGGVQSNQFDILIPGGGVGALNGCSKQWGSGTDLGSQYGGYLAECNGDSSCVQQKCQAAFGNRPQLLSGCMWFLDWFGGSNNPDFTYQKIACPSALTQASGLSDPG